MNKSRSKEAFFILKEKGTLCLIKNFMKAIDRLWKRRIHYPFMQWMKYERHYELELNPRNYIWIDPNEIHLAEWIPINKNNWNLSHVIGGDWDKKKLKFEKNPFRHQKNIETNIVYESLQEHFINEVPWENTKLFDNVIYGDMYWRGIKTKKEFEQRCDQLDQLFDIMEKKGYQTYQQRTGSPPKYPEEIKVMVGREGNFFFVDGKHRLSIAKILGLDNVAVNIVVRHKRWQKIREKIYNHNIDKNNGCFFNHPDIQNSKCRNKRIR